MFDVPFVLVAFKGFGFELVSFYYPPADIRGFKFGCAARDLLLKMPVADEPPKDRDAFVDWLEITTPAQRKIRERLWFAGLVWDCRFYNEGTDTKPRKLLALTPLGGKVLGVFGDDMRKGRRIRWEKWKYPSVAANHDYYVQTLDHFGMTKDDAVKLDPKRLPGRKIKTVTRGTGQEYLARRLARYDSIWSKYDNLSVSPDNIAPAFSPKSFTSAG